MKFLSKRQSRKVEDRRVEKDISQPVMLNASSPATDPTVVSKRKQVMDRYRSQVSSMPMLDLYKPNKRLK